MFAPGSPRRSIDREKGPRTVPMRVLVLGLSRTGTECEFRSLCDQIPSAFLHLCHCWIRITKPVLTALRKALIQLGCDGTYHGYAAAAEYPRDCEMWLRAMRAKYDGAGVPFTHEDWDRLLGDYQARFLLPTE